MNKEDIKSLGFTETTKDTFEKTSIEDPLLVYYIDYFDIDNSEDIFLKIGQNILSYEDILFQGKVKDILELKVLFRQLGISYKNKKVVT